MRIVFFGTSEFAVPILRTLKKEPEFDIVAVVTTPSKPIGKKRELVPSPVAEVAKSLGLPCFAPEKLKDPEWMKTLENLKPELAVLASYGKILPQTNLDIPKYGFINVHPSLLPKYRGASPLEGAILSGDSKTGVTIMKMDAQMDHGPILSQEEVALAGTERAAGLEEKLAQLGAELLVKTIPSYIHGEIVPAEQNHEKATFTKLIKRDDGRVDLKNDPKEIWRKYRAYDPWPGIWTVLSDKRQGTSDNGHGQSNKAQETRIKLLDVELIDGKIKINKLQPEGKKPMTAAEFERGYGPLTA